MKFRYIGDYPAGQTALVCFGRYSFSPGAEIDLPEPFATKARGNRFFQAAEPIADSIPPQTLAPPDHDPPLPLEPPTREQLIALAEEHGVKIDGRWGHDKIREAIVAHANQPVKA